MSQRDNIVSTYLSDDEKADLSRMADESDESQSSIVRKAVLEYLDHDRNARIEAKVREIDDKLERTLTLLDEDEHTHTSKQSKASSTVEKARSIARRIHSNHEPPVKAVAVERAIEDIAGADDRTLDKYKDILKKRGLLYRHPSESPVWTDDRREWAGWVESYVNATPSASVDDYTDDYSIEIDEYERLAAQVQL